MSTLTSNFDRTQSVIKKREKWERPRPCWCTGYWFPHRTGGGACEHSKTRDIHMARRHQDYPAMVDAQLAYILAYPGKGVKNAPCPF